MSITQQQVLVLAILLFFAVIILGCFCTLVIPSPGTGFTGPAFVLPS